MTATVVAGAPVQVLYGSESGNGEYVAGDLVKALAERGIDAQRCELDARPLSELSDGGVALIVVSTYGEGEMPYGAEDFWDRIADEDAPELTALRYAVLALGDRTYEYFCEAGRRIDDRLAALGATRIADRAECDAHFRRDAAQWISARVEQLVEQLADPARESASSVVSPDGIAGEDPDSEQSVWTRDHPFAATLLSSRVLTAGLSGNEVRHYEFDLSGSGIDHRPGDSLAVIPLNDPAAVEQFLDAAATSGEVLWEGLPLSLLAREHWELRFPSLALLDTVAARAPGSELGAALTERGRVAADSWIATHSVPETLRQLSAPLTTAELAAVMSPIRYRAYSIASSARSDARTVHLAVTTQRHPAGSVLPGGVASSYLDRLCVGEEVRAFPLPNRAFKLPPEQGSSIVMVGPGVGVAPFRAFLMEREQSSAPGRAWLFTGTRHQREGLPYQADWERLLASGTLTRLDVAYSRDQSRRIHVQDLMRDQADELVRWLQAGAYFYVCGDAKRMAVEVEETLASIATAVLGANAGAELIDRLHRERRFLRDVY